MLFPLLAAISNALYQITTRLLHDADLPLTTLFYTALAGTLSVADFCPLGPSCPSPPIAG